MVPESVNAPGPALTRLLVPETTPESVRAAVPYC